MKSVAVLGLALTFALAGCLVEVDYGHTSFQCPDGRCPGDQLCIANMCVAQNVPDAGPTLDSTSAPDGSPDSMVVVDSAVMMPDATLPNLLSNSGLEVGFDPWTPFVATFRGTIMTPHGGLRAVVVCKDPTGTNDLFTAYADVVNGPAVPVGARFRASVWVRKSFAAAEAAPPYLKLVLRERGGALPNRDVSGPVVMPITTNWVQLTSELTVTDPGRTQINVLIWPGDTADGVCFAFDDAVAERLP